MTKITIHSQGNLHGLHLGTADLNNRQMEYL